MKFPVPLGTDAIGTIHARRAKEQILSFEGLGFSADLSRGAPFGPMVVKYISPSEGKDILRMISESFETSTLSFTSTSPASRR